MAEPEGRPPSVRPPGWAWGAVAAAFVGGVAVALAVVEFVGLRPDHRAPYLVGWGGAAAWWLAQRLRDRRAGGPGPDRPALPAGWPVYGAALAAAGALCAVGWMVDVHVLAAVWATGVYYSVVPPPGGEAGR